MVHNVPDIAGTGAAVPLIPGGVRTSAAWVQISTGANTAAVRIGDNTTSAASGTIVEANTVCTFPPLANAEPYDLSQIYAFITAGDHISIVYCKT